MREREGEEGRRRTEEGHTFACTLPSDLTEVWGYEWTHEKANYSSVPKAFRQKNKSDRDDAILRTRETEDEEEEEEKKGGSDRLEGGEKDWSRGEGGQEDKKENDDDE